MFQYFQEGNSLDTLSTDALHAGEVIDYLGNGKLIGVVKIDAEAGQPGSVDIGASGGVYICDKNTTDVIAKGDTLYAKNDSTLGWIVTTTATGNLLFGMALEAAAADVKKLKVIKFGPQATL